ncbi:hypothetical protein AKJ61_01320 [candidate division MSBL1 archaeon SCGC-AAA259B11]|uniref:Dehydrogenase n=1 Tax=candidate division MSBL1 archaeon SCGC-AAA259B11 TaxID=1698260 RepID=A0A133U7J2_9EURY|nr:hypothetical protein AKJ61_01320 [candidate division MSBL1 archaeon SCGC-AAA259B11]
MRLKNKTCIITGSGRGIGQAYAEGFGKEGANVVVSDIIEMSDTVKKVEETGASVIAVECDVTNSEQCKELAERAMDEFGSIDVLVNNAAIFGDLTAKPLDKWSEGKWDQVMKVNVKGVWLASLAVLPYMKEQGDGDIINISSSTIFSGVPLLLPYVASKGAIFSMTRSMARELSGTGIRVNAITPGYTMTEAGEEMFETEDQFEKFRKKVTQDLRVVQRDEQPEDLVGTAVFLASDESNFISGQTINVDGGEAHH